LEFRKAISLDWNCRLGYTEFHGNDRRGTAVYMPAGKWFQRIKTSHWILAVLFMAKVAMARIALGISPYLHNETAHRFLDPHGGESICEIRSCSMKRSSG